MNNKGADQTAQMRTLSYAFVVCIVIKQVFSWCGSFGIISQYDPKFDLNINEVTVTYISWSSDFVLHLEDYLMYEHHTLGLYRTFDLKINVGLCDLYFMVEWFCLISPRLFDAWVSYLQIMRQCDPNFDLKVNISQQDLYFIVLWFCLISSRLFDGWTS